ncbi:hypothetical protein Dsin_030227 [Dipteronia sinensis]|uniref:Uncharacterized protein n=1 Tax=Dipteronia sinensis TaxID=43782 RepID=A0AAE0DQS7_9ROSI|nr:hypothetical protein Dsin_030227 [Dipteronia sinensis]
MAHSLQRIWSDGGAMRGTVCPLSRPLSSDALVQLKPGEIGLVFEIPEEHLLSEGCNLLSKDLEYEGSGKSILYRHKTGKIL